ncbi:MAG: sigma-70 family RNA polymerase sigma factor [Planctomycetales bacterium]|nr:sigma-70 family RNA polymerase sigma factor [Planctomycetales bacterium]
MSFLTLAHNDLAAQTRHEDSESDEALLDAFVTSRDDLAFAKVVTRHASLVMGVCRRVLGNDQDAEDAFQATFLVLARKANSLKNANSLPAWLHKTSHRISLRARAQRARRREQSLESEFMLEDRTTLQRIAKDHERSALDEELNRLPDRYRLPLFLCCLEGKSREEAARQLGWSSSSLKGRLERARQLLRRRLILRGISLGVAAALVMRSQSVVQAAVRPDLVASTVQAGMRYAAGQSPVGYVSSNAHLLANWSLQTMSITSAKFALCALLVTGTLTLGSQWTVGPASAQGSGSEIVLQQTNTPSPEITFVALLDDEQPAREREGAREREQPRRESEEPRRDGDRPRESETRRDGDRPREADGRREEEPRRDTFKPQTEREEMLYRMIQQLQREVAELRNAVRSRGDEPRRDGDQPRREGDRPRESDGDRPGASREGEREAQAGRQQRWELTKEGKVFKAYDKNGDRTVSVEEWLAMQEGEMTDERRALAVRRFKEAEPSGDGKFTVEEFLHWYTKGRYQDTREGDRRESEGR